MNPPYGRQIGKWMEKAYKESLSNADIVVCLVPARTDTKWWHDWALKGKVIFVKGRLKFNDGKQSAPFPSAVVIFDRNATDVGLNTMVNYMQEDDTTDSQKILTPDI